LHGRKTWSLTSKEEHSLSVFENTVLRRIFGPHRDEMTAGLGKLGAEVVQLLQSLRTGLLGLDPRQEQRNFPLASVSRPGLRPTQPPIQWVPEVKHSRGVTPTTHPHLLLRPRMSRSYISSPPWRLHGGSRTVLLLLGKTTF
jgi:hypothetical protein